ncbi:Uncharacterized protein BM_BM446 [Brugia malayi]|uniref:Uncharacterized protein n=1 Tax=Brugia malayi TaxID=6279 RepID=A0A4E9FCP9_BRUMA|nr:Uncharacterized protein BM_BM446 [Brugia malayi]VIO94567.1 Uncharacterized protein BM_BM446 [Brugia malayi]
MMMISSVDSGFVDSNYSGISPNMTKCKCGCHEGKQCTCKECPDKSAGKSKCVGSCHGGSTGTHQEKDHEDAMMALPFGEVMELIDESRISAS